MLSGRATTVNSVTSPGSTVAVGGVTSASPAMSAVIVTDPEPPLAVARITNSCPGMIGMYSEGATCSVNGEFDCSLVVDADPSPAQAASAITLTATTARTCFMSSLSALARWCARVERQVLDHGR
jgi:hypothetical protein